jgi:predicted TPR repeat methyltransferase
VDDGSDPVHVLLDETEPSQRARALVALGDRALARGGTAMAVRHFREALRLDAAVPGAKERLAALGEPVQPFEPPPRSVLDRLLGR